MFFHGILEMVGTDHRPTVAFLEDKVPRSRGQLQFDKRWIAQDGLLDSICKGWFEFGGSNESDFIT